jgi:hypothetical protein
MIIAGTGFSNRNFWHYFLPLSLSLFPNFLERGGVNFDLSEFGVFHMVLEKGNYGYKKASCKGENARESYKNDTAQYLSFSFL